MTSPSNRVFRSRVSPSIVIAVTLLPEPDSPTIAEHLAAVELEADAVHRADDAVLGRELDLQVLDLEQALGHQVGRILGSRYAYRSRRRALKRTMKNAP